MGHRSDQLRIVGTKPAQYVCIVQARHEVTQTERDHAINSYKGKAESGGKDPWLGESLAI